MAWKTKTERFMLDDIDGSTATEEISFAFEGVAYEIHLNEEHANELREALAKFVDNARRAGGRRRRRAGAATGRTSDAAAIRAWARSRGIEVPDRGRIPADVREQYYAEVGA
ncbi:Lsr2 family protein [Buchananella felis]|uniref:histone-like nucleoid-structuring protein Lsr2 n=1 Tax=Buchananella felis TaxID=3231492 RepID=UPI003528297F